MNKRKQKQSARNDGKNQSKEKQKIGMKLWCGEKVSRDEFAKAMRWDFFTTKTLKYDEGGPYNFQDLRRLGPPFSDYRDENA